MGTDKRARQKANRAKKIEQVQKVEKRGQRRHYLLVVALLAVSVAALAFVLSLTGGDDTATDASATDATAVTDNTATAPATTAVPTNDAPAVSTPAPGATSTGTPTCPAADGSSKRTTTFAQAPPICIDETATYSAELETNLGTITVDLDAEAAPATVNNFVFLARYHYYDGTPFHRIIKDFVIQGGDASGDIPGFGNPGYTIAEETPTPADGEKAYQVGSLAMAKGQGPSSTGAQFFIVTGDAGANLPPQYSLFGTVTEGMDVVKAIEALPTNADDYPTEEIYITSVTISEN